MFETLLFNLRAEGVRVGLSEWLVFLRALRAGLVTDAQGLYDVGRAVLVHSETEFDAWDLAFHATFAGVEIDADLLHALADWLRDPRVFAAAMSGAQTFKNLEELLEALRRTLAEQRERHDGGDRWVGTGGTSPYGTGGRANQGVQLGDAGGGRSAVRLAEERRWRNYRTDVPLDVRDFTVALQALRHLAREGDETLDLPETVASTARNAGEIELVYRRERANRVRLVLLMDAGGSMDPYEHLVSRLFTAAREARCFKTFEHYYFHNCVLRWLYRDYESYDRRATADILRDLVPEHRLIFVGDACMAPSELFSGATTFGRTTSDSGPTGIDWLRSFASTCRASIWLNPDPPATWGHPTVSAIGSLLRMFPLTLEGLRDGIRYLRAPR